MDKAIKRQKVVKDQPIEVDFDAGAEACGNLPTEKEIIRTGNKFYRPPLP